MLKVHAFIWSILRYMGENVNNDNIVVENLKLSLIRCVFILLNYIFAIGGGYSKIATYIMNKGVYNENNSINMMNLMLYVIIILITLILTYPLIQESFKGFRRVSFNDLFSILSLMSIILVLIITIANRFGVGVGVSLNQLNNEVSLKNNIFYFTFVTLIYAPIVEEVVFRGALYQIINNMYGKFIAIIVSSFLFGAIHNIFFLNNWSATETIYFIIYFVMGVAFCISYDYTKSILGAIINHFLWNLFTVIIMIIKIKI